MSVEPFGMGTGKVSGSGTCGSNSFITCLGIGAPLGSRDPPYYPPPTPVRTCSAACSAACYSSTTQHGPVGRGGSSPVLAFHRTASLREPRKSQPTLLCWPQGGSREVAAQTARALARTCPRAGSRRCAAALPTSQGVRPAGGRLLMGMC